MTDQNTMQVQEGENYEVEIISIGEKGDGIAKINGLVIIVPGGQVGELLNVKITKVGKRCAFSKVVK
jgi:predicted RNA-binding protein with TRAM domain